MKHDGPSGDPRTRGFVSRMLASPRRSGPTEPEQPNLPFLETRFGLKLSSTEDHKKVAKSRPTCGAVSTVCLRETMADALRMVPATRMPGAVRRICPLPDRARVNVDELTFGVVTHTTCAE